MRIKKLFNTEAEYLDYAWSFIDFDENKVWRKEDLPELKPFFAFEEKHRGNSYKLNKEEKESFDYYRKCYDEYAKDLFELRDSIRGFSSDELTEFFFLEPIGDNCHGYDENDNEIDENGNIIPPTSRETIKIADEWRKDLTFPLYFIGWIDSSFDRYGDVRMAFSDFVSLKEFN